MKRSLVLILVTTLLLVAMVSAGCAQITTVPGLPPVSPKSPGIPPVKTVPPASSAVPSGSATGGEGSIPGAPAVTPLPTSSAAPSTPSATPLQPSPSPNATEQTPAVPTETSGQPVPPIPTAVEGAGDTGGGGRSSPGYPTGPLNMYVAASLLLDKTGTVKADKDKLEISERQYEANGIFPMTVNGKALIATSLKVVSNVKLINNRGEHLGTIDVDIDTVPGGHLTLEYRGTATMSGATIVSNGAFKTTDVTGTFAGLVADGTYKLTIIETADILGSSVTITLTTKSL